MPWCMSCVWYGIWWEGSLLRLRASFLKLMLGITLWRNPWFSPSLSLMKTTLSWTVTEFLLNWSPKQWSIDLAFLILTCSNVYAGGNQELCQHKFRQQLMSIRDFLVLAPLPHSVCYCPLLFLSCSSLRLRWCHWHIDPILAEWMSPNCRTFQGGRHSQGSNPALKWMACTEIELTILAFLAPRSNGLS